MHLWAYLLAELNIPRSINHFPLLVDIAYNLSKAPWGPFSRIFYLTKATEDFRMSLLLWQKIPDSYESRTKLQTSYVWSVQAWLLTTTMFCFPCGAVILSKQYFNIRLSPNMSVKAWTHRTFPPLSWVRWVICGDTVIAQTIMKCSILVLNLDMWPAEGDHQESGFNNLRREVNDRHLS